MHKTPSISWVKNVYNLCAQYGKTCVRIYTAMWVRFHQPSEVVVQPPSYTRFTTRFSPILYTAIITYLTPLNTYLSPLSTAPIISKTN